MLTGNCMASLYKSLGQSSAWLVKGWTFLQTKLDFSTFLAKKTVPEKIEFKQMFIEFFILSAEDPASAPPGSANYSSGKCQKEDPTFVHATRRLMSIRSRIQAIFYWRFSNKLFIFTYWPSSKQSENKTFQCLCNIVCRIYIQKSSACILKCKRN